ncbi:MAG: TonB-dependent receptor domain-containing protein, partial [Leadbetterella sp.]
INYHQTTVWDLDYKLQIVSKLGKTALGTEIRNEAVLSNRLGDSLYSPLSIPNTEKVYYYLGKERTNYSFFLEHNYTLDKLNIVGGAMVNRNSNYGTSFYPGIDISYSLLPYVRIFGSANKSLRYPTFTELYLKTATLTADKNLKPEKATSYEIGGKTFFATHKETVALFYRQTQDAIDKIKRPNITIPRMENVDNINMVGIEASSVWDLRAIFKKRFFDKLQVNYAYLLADRKEENFQSFYTLNYLNHKMSIQLTNQLTKRLTLQTAYTLKTRLGEYEKLDKSGLTTYKPIHLVDMRFNYTYSDFRVFLDINNLADYRYYEFAYVEQPGRWISVGFNFSGL